MAGRQCVTVVIVTYNSEATITACLSSLFATAADYLTSVVVVDNASTDRTIETLREFEGRIRMIGNRDNLGFGRACNMGARDSTGEFLMFLNPDAVVHERAVAELVAFLDARVAAACCGPLIEDRAGKPDPACRRGFPTPMNAIGRLFYLENVFPSSRAISTYTLPWLGFDREAHVDCVSGACLFIRRSDFAKLSGFDEEYFLFGEDIDLCRRVADSGRETWYVPAARVVHAGGHSMLQERKRANREFYRAMHIYLEKHWRKLPRWQFALVHAGVGIRAFLEKYIGH